MSGMEFTHLDRIILVITALSEERKSVLPFLRRDSITPKSDKHGRDYITGDYYVSDESRPWHIVLPSPTSAGNAKSATETALSLALGPAFVFLLGVAGGFPTKVNMYDVVVAERVYDVDVAKIDPEGIYIPRPDQHKATSVLLTRAKTLQDLGGWQELLHPDIPNEEIHVWIEPIAAGSKLVASSCSDEFKRITRDAPRAVAVENEGFGVMQAAHEAAVAALVIRGISDLIDNRPKDDPAEKDERVGPDRHKLKAARHAAAFMFALIGRLTSNEIEQVAKDKDDWVVVRLRWDDFKEIAKGKSIVVEFMAGTAMRDMTGKVGSVEIEFKTKRLVSAFVYAVSLERDLLREMIGVVPDRVDTTIDTSDPDVARIFSAVRNLASKNGDERQQGEREVQVLAGLHDSLKAFAEKAVHASRKAATLTGPISAEDDAPYRRVLFTLSDAFKDHLHSLAAANKVSLTVAAAKLLEAAADDSRTSSVSLDGFFREPGTSQKRITATVSRELFNKLGELAEVRYKRPRSQVCRALIGYAIEMRLTDLFEHEQSEWDLTLNPEKSP